MADIAELVMEGVPLVTEHYDKVYDPVKNKTKQGVNKIKQMRNSRNGGYESESDYEEVDRYGPPQRSQTDRRRTSPRDDFDDRRRSRRGGEVVEERYAYSKGNGRARSLGRQRGWLEAPILRTTSMLTQLQEVDETTPTPNPPSPHPVVNAANH